MDQDHGQDTNEPSSKKRQLDEDTNDHNYAKIHRRGMDKSISPPPLRRRMIESPKQEVLRKKVKISDQDKISLEQTKDSPKQKSPDTKHTVEESPKQKVVKSPFQLTSIRDLPASSNVDTVSLKDILGDPLISECWEFNYLHNLDFLMEQFDEDVRKLVKVNVIHGFWKRDNQSRINLEEQASKYDNIKLLTAYMPEMFGTHHSKMLILFRHDSTAQVIIHTANMIPFDWTNMTQALWKSPLLPLLDIKKLNASEAGPIGSGSKFKLDLLNYLRAYDTKRVICKPLIEQLLKHDFSSIRAALVASAPGKQDIELSSSKTAWGWAGLKNVLKCIPCNTNNNNDNNNNNNNNNNNTQPEIVIQISSIASLGPTDKWLTQTFFKALSTTKSLTPRHPQPQFKIIFPTADEIRRSINGYASGNAIHTKILTPAQGKQLAYLKPMLCHWAGDGAQHSSSSNASQATSNPPNPITSPTSLTSPFPPQNAHRKRAAPHIKTYIRFSSPASEADPSSAPSSEPPSIDWHLLTSANLSKQAWGETVNAAGEIRICSYEIGVCIWPGLWDEEGEGAKMVPVFGEDMPSFLSDVGVVGETEKDEDADVEVTDGNGQVNGDEDGEKKRETGNPRNVDERKSNETSIGARMAYDLPIIPYTKDDVPWCATDSYTEPDWMGNTWNT